MVDDTYESLALLDRILTPEGYLVRPADSGELALAAVAANPPDLILLDIRMKGLDGLEVCRRLKAVRQTQHIPIILFSAKAGVEEAIAGLQLGAADYISKPFPPEELLARVKTHLSLSLATISLKEQAATLLRTNEELQAEITQRKRAEQALRLGAAMMANVTEGVYLVGVGDLLIKWTNERFAGMFGYGPGELVGKHVDIVNAPTEKTPSAPRISIMDVLKATGEWRGEVRNIKRDGTHFWCYAIVSLFDHPEHGKVMVSVHTNITDLKRAEEARRKSEVRYRGLFDNSPMSLWEEDFSKVKDLLDALRSSGVSDLRAHLKARPD
ncbi:MAG: response regulator, partial [Anaerolineae bacterium]|nr:response regulator [Anaerolineae bacterium]